MATIVIDAGHGGTTEVGGSSPNNATGPNGTLEKDLTLDLAKRLRPLLTGSHDVLMTRTTDVNLSLSDRAKVAKDSAAEVFLSMHFNGFKDESVQGTETLVWEGTTPPAKSYLLAQKIQASTVAVTGYRDRGVKNEQALGVLDPHRHNPDTARCLVEISFITGPGAVAAQTDETRLSDEDYRDTIAAGLASGISDFLAG